MKLINDQLYLESADRKECGMNEAYLIKARSVGTKCFTWIDDPYDNRKALLEYESLPEKYKDQVKKRFGNPYDQLAKEPIRKMVTKDLDAEKFYMEYRFDGKMLPIEKVKEYTTAASWLNMLAKADENKKEIKRLLNLSVTEFFVKVIELIKQDNISLPSHYVRLREKINQFKVLSYPCLIHKQFGNTNAKKVNSEVAEATLLEMIANHNQYDDVFIAYQYNRWAKENDHAEISPATVGNYRRKNLSVVIAQREGNAAFNEKFIRQVKGLRPQTPLSLVEHDDNNLDFLFSDETGYQFNKYVSIVVLDSCTKLVLGYSYALGKSPEQWMVHHAYLNAMYYIRSLTGQWYLPFEIKADKWAQKSLEPFYNNIAKFIRPSHGNKHRGYIEPFFGSPLWKRAQKMASDGNWSGNNMTAKNRGVNQEAVKLAESFRPMIGNEAEQQIENFFHLLRHMPDIKRTDMQSASKEQQFLQEWAKLSDADKKPITDEQFLLRFGIKHQPKHTNGIRITNRGIEPQIRNMQYSYDLPESWMYNKLVGEQVEVYYDPFDMSRVLVTDNKNIRFVATTAQLAPRALKDTETGSRTYLNFLLSEKKGQVQEAGKASEKRKRIAEDAFNAEAMLQGGVLVKEQKNLAEQRMLEDSFNNEYESFLDDNYDLSQFFNSKSA